MAEMAPLTAMDGTIKCLSATFRLDQLIAEPFVVPLFEVKGRLPPYAGNPVHRGRLIQSTVHE
jgi:hypothetical protein